MSHKPQHSLTPEQYKEYLAYLRSHHYTKAERRAFDAAKRRKEAAKKRAAGKHKRHAGHLKRHGGSKRGLAVAAAPGLWFGNDTLETCAAVAAANSLLAQTGQRVTEQDIRTLHAIAGSDDGTILSDLICALMDCGIGGFRPRSALPADHPAGHMILGVTLGAGSHAVVLDAGDVITWGHRQPGAGFTGLADEGWLIRW